MPPVEVWGFIWLMFLLKIPIVMLLTLVWWAIKQTEPTEDQGEGGIGDRPKPHHPRKPSRRRRPRGPHGDPAPLPSPVRVRTVQARARSVPRDS